MATTSIESHEDSQFLHHTACPSCGSSDANSVYTDGHEYCFACGYHKNAVGGSGPGVARSTGGRVAELVEITEYFSKRGITQSTSEHFGYGVGEYKGKKCHVAPYFDADGQLVAQKLRYPDHTFSWVGDSKVALPFGASRFQKAGKMLVVTEGEIDALSVSQIQGNKWPVVSIGCGAGPQIKKYIAQHREYFLGFDKVILMFDMDQPGRDAAAAAAEVLGMKAHIAELPGDFKDANEMLVAGKVQALTDAIWRAKQYRPEGIVDLASLRAASQSKTGAGIPGPYKGMDRITYGLRTGELIGIGSGTGAGKTDFLTELMTWFVMEKGVSFGAFFLESTPVELSQRYAGKIASKPFHIPDGAFTQADIDGAWDKIEGAKAKAYLYDSFGVNEWLAVRAKMEYLHHAEGVQFFILDHLTAFAAGDPENERTILEGIMGDMGSLVKKLPITIIYVSHLATPEGKSHEEGGHVAMRHFKGSRALGFWTHIAFGLERNQQAEDRLERFTTTVRCVKNRLFGHLNGEVFYLRYDPLTGRQVEVDDPKKGNEYGFTDTTAITGAPLSGASDF